MRRIMTGDLHMSHNPRDDYRFAFMKWLERYARKHKPDQIVLAGDLTEEKDRHPAELVNKVVDHVHALATICPVVALEGNHDYKDEGHAFFAFLSRIPNTRWISKPTVIGDMLCLPHTNDYKRDWADIDMGTYRTRVCHQTFNGAAVGFGRTLDGIPLDVLPRKGHTFCGDIHVPQSMERLVYIGAPYHVDFGDDFTSRIIEQTDGKWASVDTSTLPQKRAFTVSPDDVRATLAKANAGDIVQITVDVEDMDDWTKVSDSIMKYAAKRELRVWAVKPKVLKRAVRRKHTVSDAVNDTDVLEAFGKRHGVSSAIMKRGEKLL